MHESSMLRMKWFADNYANKINKEKIKILDVGSYDVNGSYKEYFLDKKYSYSGLDMEKGPNVDIVLKNPYDWSRIKTDSYDIVISGQAFEHMEFFWVVLTEMARVLRKDGLLCIIAPNGFEEHRFPVDCYRFFSDGMGALARYASLEILHTHTNSAHPKDFKWYSDSCADSMLVAKKGYSGKTKILNFKKYKCVPLDQASHLDGMTPYGQLAYETRIFFKLRVLFGKFLSLPRYLKNKIISQK
jgi:SAM-dependent methyltransferase